MKISILILALSVSLFGSFSKANESNDLICEPEVNNIGGHLSVRVAYASNVAEVTYGDPSLGLAVQTTTYQVVKTSNNDLTVVTFYGQWFQLAIVESSEKGHLIANVSGHNVDVDNLKCNYKSAMPLPGVSMSNIQGE